MVDLYRFVPHHRDLPMAGRNVTFLVAGVGDYARQHGDCDDVYEYQQITDARRRLVAPGERRKSSSSCALACQTAS
jgi:hypothetical protein